MKNFLSGPNGQLFALLFMSFAAGVMAMVAFEYVLRGNSVWMLYAGVTFIFLVSISLNAVRFRKTIPS
jgi:hypothetical protein